MSEDFLSYRARIPWRTPSPDAVSILTATLPTEYLRKGVDSCPLPHPVFQHTTSILPLRF